MTAPEPRLLTEWTEELLAHNDLREQPPNREHRPLTTLELLQRELREIR